MRRWYLPVAGLLAVVVAAGAWFVLRPEADKPVAASCANPVAPGPEKSTALRNAIAAPGGAGGLTVVEGGFAPIRNGAYVSVGAVIENSSDRVAYHTRITLQATTADGASVLTPGQQLLIEIPFIRPGERAIAGNVAGVAGGATVAGARIDLVETRWAPTAETATFPVIVTVLDTAEPPARDAPNVPLRVTSNSCGELTQRGAMLIYRDGSGRLTGGVYNRDRYPGERCGAGTQLTRIRMFWEAPAAADLSRSEAAVLCDVAGFAPDPLESGAPLN
jgi:hypothetical protein